MTAPGYSGKPLAEKLGLKPGMIAVSIDAPDDYEQFLDSPIPITQQIGDEAPNFVHIFVTERARMDALLTNLFHRIDRDGMVWVSWPKKSSKMPTDIDENVIRDVCLPMGWVDVKVCAVTDVWSGLKLVIRKELRR
ncbi:MAG: DUF3052 domain-containing protein [Armatimonadetes bacterium]|nr:DUF3052 domain-containing protein [Armatimonadota bacterium]